MKITINYPNFFLRACIELPKDGAIAIYGPSGSGKSSILRAMAGLIAGAEQPLERATLGYLPQNYSLFANLSIAENLLSCRRKTLNDELKYWIFAKKISLKNFLKKFKNCGEKNCEKIHEKIQEKNHEKIHENFLDENLLYLLKAAGIDHLANAYPSELSGGQRQRAALCCALANNPKYLLLDEPFSALDDESKRALISLLHRFMRDFSLSVVLISHSAAEVAALAKEVYILQNGQIEKRLKISEFCEEFDKPL